MNNESTRFRLRPATPLDAVAIAAVWARSIREVCSPAYCDDPEVIEPWASLKTPDFVLRLLKHDDLFVVAEVDGVIAGLGCAFYLTDSIACYVSPDFLHMGIGRAILDRIEQGAWDHSHSRLVIHSSLNAVGFYERCGYRRNGPVRLFGNSACIPLVKDL
jgi:GNAT superfamily N-acetyltransferase